jgi:hypothetical protein
MPLALSTSTRLLAAGRRHVGPRLSARPYSTPSGAQKSGHALWYADMVPGMIPVALLGSAVYLVSMHRLHTVLVHAPVLTEILWFQALQLTRQTLSQDKWLEEAHARIQQLEVELELLRAEQRTAAVPQSTLVQAEEAAKDGKRQRWSWIWSSRP